MEKFYFFEKREELPRFELTVKEVMELAKSKTHYANLWSLLEENQVKPLDKV